MADSKLLGALAAKVPLPPKKGEGRPAKREDDDDEDLFAVESARNEYEKAKASGDKKAALKAWREAVRLAAG